MWLPSRPSELEAVRLGNHPAVQRLIADAEQRAAQEAADARRRAMNELKALDAQAEADGKRLDADVATARAAAKKAKAAADKAAAAVATLQRQGNRASALRAIRRQRLEAVIRGAVPQVVGVFLEWAAAELRRLANARPSLDTTREPTVWGLWHRGPDAVTFYGNGPAIVARAEALADAAAEARRLAGEPLTDAELAERVDELRAGIPAIELKPLAGRPLPELTALPRAAELV